jgi:hypothetical protein
MIESIGSGFFLKLGNSLLVDALIDVELIVPLELRVSDDRRDVDIEQSVPIHVYDRNPGRPIGRPFYPSVLRDFFELKISGVEVKPIRALIGSKIEIGAPIITKVSDRNSSSIVKVRPPNHIQGA